MDLWKKEKYGIYNESTLNTSKNDDIITDLNVGRLLQREKLDYDTFGKSNVRQYVQGSTKPQPENVNTTSQIIEDFDLNSIDNLNVDIKTRSTNKVNNKAKQEDTTANNTIDPVIDINNLDLNNYIASQNKNENAGLFD
jgi:hypothetical protein